MDHQTESNAKSTNTPTSRRVGLSRKSPKMELTKSQLNRSHKVNDAEQNVPTAMSESAEDLDLMVTPAKRSKISYDRSGLTAKQQTDNLNEPKLDAKQNGSKTVDELKAEIQKMKDHLKEYENYNNKKKELKQLIEVWRAGGSQALHQLQAVIQPEQELEKILEHFGLPVEIFGNIDD